MAAIFDAGEQAALRTTGLNMFRGLKLYVLGQVAVAAASLSQIGASVYHGDYTATTFICAALLLVAIAKLVILGNVSLRAAPAVKSAVTRHQANPVGMFSLLTTLIARPAAPPVNLNAHIPILPVHNVVTNPFVPPSAVLNNALQNAALFMPMPRLFNQSRIDVANNLAQELRAPSAPSVPPAPTSTSDVAEATSTPSTSESDVETLMSTSGSPLIVRRSSRRRQ